MNLTLAEMAEKLRAYKEYRIIYHIRPDGDCIGSAFALALALQSIGAKCEVTGTYPVPNCHREMTDRIPMDTLEDPVYIAVDSAAPQRTGDYADTHFTFCIDHHRDNSVMADYKYVEEDCGACSEIIYKLICEMGITVTKQMADLLYTALVTDTMCFRTSDTDVQSFEIAAALARCGADTFGIARKHMFLKSKGRMNIEKIVQDHFHFTCDGRVLTTTISLEDLEKAGIADSDLEGINSLVDQVEGVRVGVTIRQQPNGKTRCSTRTNGNVAANAICAAHGGGGHEHAACCDLDVSMKEAKEIMERTAMEFLMKADAEVTV